jgi:hypothetical protein
MEKKLKSTDYKKRLLKSAEFYKKRIDKLKKEKKEENENLLIALKNINSLRHEEAEEFQKEIQKLYNLIGVMKTGRIKYEREVEGLTEKPTKNGGYLEMQKISGVIFINELEQVEVRKDHVILITKSQREIWLSSEYDFLDQLFL